jgi:23S rRNA (cytidine2498-2'-O)-methyltransferase
MSFSFLYALCREGAEPLLKAEVAKRHRKLLTPAFMRPGLLTWKAREPLPAEFDPGLIFGRNWGFSLGMLPEMGIADAPDRFQEALPGEQPVRWDVYPRIVPEDGVPPEAWAQADRLRTELPPDGAGRTWIAEVIFGAEGEALFLGARRLKASGPVSAGGLSRSQLPEDSPSRAWLKVEQAFAWAGWDRDGRWIGKRALELGSSPGGISLALVRRGFSVEAVDPAPMDPRVLAETGPGGAKVTHLRQPVGGLEGADRRGQIDLLVSDMNLAPPAVIRYLERLQARTRTRHWIITLKLNDAAMTARLPDFRERLEQIAPKPLRIVQLPANRSEVTVIAGGG